MEALASEILLAKVQAAEAKKEGRAEDYEAGMRKLKWAVDERAILVELARQDAVMEEMFRKKEAKVNKEEVGKGGEGGGEKGEKSSGKRIPKLPRAYQSSTQERTHP